MTIDGQIGGWERDIIVLSDRREWLEIEGMSDQ